ncbi:MAG: electron transfer flavoprotein subunit alpha/FixB family protein [Eubacteriales bacterium]|nr:electron transfer flavoprotein subunit alpha/FixB family protein [Clostridiales bacterium]MDY5837006.1 electron transfer flavoprotein subunit alpha/FixB family protein [Eubacteriales bacterium]
MRQGICIYAEAHNGVVSNTFAELLTAARELQKTTGEEISALVVASNSAKLCADVEAFGVDRILGYDLSVEHALQDDAIAKVISEILKDIEPSSVLVPASPEGRSIFSRVAMRLNCGLTADCTELLVGVREDGGYYIKHNKPSFGDNVYVSIIIREDFFPQILTIRHGVYNPAKQQSVRATYCDFSNMLSFPSSGVKVVSREAKAAVTDSISSAEKVVVVGKGMESLESLELAQAFADRIGAALACTRPLSDVGLMPFERQIGQTGCTIRPKLCISIGVSGAIQHTEGIKDVETYIAINTDPHAAIFREANYGIVADANILLKTFLEKS